MQQITQFKPTLYLLILMGMVGFAVASQSPAVLVLGGGGVAINAWLVRTGRFRRVPRWLANVVTIAAFLLAAQQWVQFREGRTLATDPLGNPVLIIGHFLVLLQLVKLWEQRLNRDYGQLLVLSLLLMVAASINTNRVVFGILLVAYLFVSLYCCLLFHLKVEGDRARAAGAIAGADVPPATVRQERRGLGRSMRRLTGVVAACGLVVATVTFLFFPRGPASGMLAQGQLLPAQAQTGYTDTVSFQLTAPLLSDGTVVAHARVTRDGAPLEGGDSIYIRGATNSRYRSDPTRDSRRDYTPVTVGPAAAGVPTPLPPVAKNEVAPAFSPGVDGTRFGLRLEVDGPVGGKDLFFVSGTGIGGGAPMAMARSFEAALPLELREAGDGSLRSSDMPSGKFSYAVDSSSDGRAMELFAPAQATYQGKVVPALRVVNQFHTLRAGQLIVKVAGRPVSEIPEQLRQMTAREAYFGGYGLWAMPEDREVVRGGPALRDSYIPPEVAAYARRVEVGGEDDQGPLVAKRNPLAYVDPVDEEIARNIERHLHTKFSYTTDITDAKTRSKLDPIVWFLSDDGKRGHCEYFAWSMALMCQSVGMKSARVALGFRCDEYNPFLHQYVVKQLHAHAWVEVLTTSGWRTFDPTSGRGGDTDDPNSGFFQQARHLFDWLESAYTNRIIYYNNEARDNLIQSVESQMTKPLYAGVNQGWLTRRLTDSPIYQALADPASGTLMVIAGLGVVGFLAWYCRRLLRKWMLRRRADRIGLDTLPDEARLRLAGQLGFYDDLLRLFERRNVGRSAAQTPMEFAGSLLFLPADAFATVRRLTGLFYRVRYGNQQLSGGLQRRLAAVVARLDVQLGAKPD